MSDSQPEDLTACLDDAQRRYEVFGESGAMPRLLAAVEAVRDLADGWDSLSSTTTVPALQSTLLRTRAFELRETISRALLGEGETDG